MRTNTGRLTENLSIFHYDYKDAQYPSTVRCSYLDNKIPDDRCFIDGDDTGATAPDARPCGTTGQQIGQRIDGGRLPSSPENKIAFNANSTWAHLRFGP